MSTSAARSPHASTPALTPPSSAQSYTSGRSPVSLASHHGMSPTHNPSTAGMYPTLPATTGQDNLSAGYPTVSSAAPPSTLSSVFDDDRRRYTGGMLQRSRPDIDLSAPSVKRDEESKLSSSVIDPALRRASADMQPEMEEDSSDRRSSSATPTPTTAPAATTDDRHTGGEQQWVENVRLLQRLRDYVLERLNSGDYAGSAESSVKNDADEEETSKDETSAETGEYPSIKMHGMEAIAAAAVAHEEQPPTPTAENPGAKTVVDAEEEAKRAGENLYPVLKMAVDDDGADTDGDEKMGR
ncbi:hypothetical protein FQN49_007935 [Arthroderma sp. PD_2]|nr:hypothetical protein FQN49_007935 [Arthroderma sp. PD_2]